MNGEEDFRALFKDIRSILQERNEIFQALFAKLEEVVINNNNNISDGKKKKKPKSKKKKMIKNTLQRKSKIGAKAKNEKKQKFCTKFYGNNQKQENDNWREYWFKIQTGWKFKNLGSSGFDGIKNANWKIIKNKLPMDLVKLKGIYYLD